MKGSKKQFFKAFKLFLLIALLLLTISSCNKKTGKAQAAEKVFSPSLTTDIKASIKICGNYSNFEALEAEFDRFNQIYPEVELTYSFLDNYNNVIVSSLYSDEAPDIFFLFPWMMGRTQYEVLFEIAEDLSLPELNINLDCIYEGNLLKTSDGKVPVLPMYSQGYGMLVNEDLFKRENLKVPATLPELLDVCQKLKTAGYKSPIMGFTDGTANIFSSIAYPYSHYLVKDNAKAQEALNNMDAAAGEYMRPLYELIDRLVATDCFDLNYCKQEFTDNYNGVILRFFEGDIPMLLIYGDVVSGTKKRESKSDAFTASPFKYRMYPTPVTDKGGIFISNTGTGFAVNSKSKQLAITNEFIRFLTQTAELNNLATNKHLIPITKDFSSDELFAPMGNGIKVYANTTTLLDDVQKQIRTSCSNIANGLITVDEAVKQYGQIDNTQ